MAYIVPRAVLVLLGWAVTCGLIVTALPDTDAAVFLFAGISWAFTGVACFGYIRRLRREFDRAQSRIIGSEPDPTF
jgi:hypothetical protein